jgi:5-(carboxyamino)imidazole ribonucleotide synthase
MNLPNNKKIGVIGAGQLGKMLAEAASPWNIKFNFLDAKNSPAERHADKFINGNIKDKEDIKTLCAISDIVTFEIEHIDSETLFEVEKEGKKIFPLPSVLKIIKDKGTQKEFYKNNNIPVPHFVVIKEEKDWILHLDEFKGEEIVVKSCTGGYDGKGVEITSKEKIKNGFRPFPTNNAMLEEKMEEMLEVSIIVAIDQKNNHLCYPPVVMEFHPITNLVMFLHTETDLKQEIIEQCNKIAIQTAKSFHSPGLFAVELFIDKENKVWVNEVAPRPHNSGHHTIEACYTSQYEQLNRILLGMPLGSTKLLCSAAMVNIVGADNLEGKYKIDNLENILGLEGVYIHMYDKSISKPARKLGHITVLANNREELFKKTELLRDIKVIPL